MLLLADSGSTKTDWLLIQSDAERLSFKTIGFNPYFVDSKQVYDTLKHEFSGRFDFSLVNEVYFYGAGCSSASKQAVIGDALNELFPGAHILVEHDLLGAARALLGHERGIAGILGTGSNSCLYDGEKVTDSLFSLGYMFGDEGSGAHLGKTFIARLLKGKVPHEIAQSFEREYGYTFEDILTNVYKKPNPNRFLASFSVFLKKNQEHPYVSQLVEDCFDAYFKEQVCCYAGHKELPFSVIGSVGYHFRTQLQSAAAKNEIIMGRFMVSPMDGLVNFHSRH